MKEKIKRAGLKTFLHKKQWTTKRFKYLFKKESRPILPDDEVVTAFRDGVVTLRSNRREEGYTFATDEIGYQGIEPGDLVIHSMDGFAGAIGISDSRGKGSPVLSIATPIDKKQEPRFWAYYLRNLATQGFIQSLAKGIRERSTDFRWNDVSNLLVNFPEFPEQKKIADFLDHQIKLIDQLIEKKSRFLEVFPSKFQVLIHHSREIGDWKRFKLCVDPVNRLVNKNHQDILVPLGLFNRGRGFFKKSETSYDELGESSFSFVQKNDLVFSGQFAWEGALGIISDKENRCIVSHRYPVYKPKKGVKSEYLFAYFRSHHGKFLMENCSRGAAGRNRPLNTNLFEKVKIPIPNEKIQEEIKNIITLEWELKNNLMPSIENLKEYKMNLINQIITGQIDIINSKENKIFEFLNN